MARPSITPIGSGAGAGLRLSVDPAWLETLRPDAFPISLDPTFVMGSVATGAYKSDGFACGGCGNRVGNSRDVQPGGWVADRYWRSVNLFDYSPVFGQPIQAASVYVGWRAAGTANAYPFHLFHATNWGFHSLGQYFASNYYVGNDGWVGSEALRAAYDYWARNRIGGQALTFAGHEVGGLYTYKQFNYFTLSLTYWDGNPFGSFDAGAGMPDNKMRVSGWAIDPDTAAPIDVHTYVDGAFAGATRADQPRPDVGNVYPGYGPNHGFNTVVPATPGAHNVCTYAINVAYGNANTLLGCRSVTVGGNPFGALEVVTGQAGGVDVRGWTIDPDSASAINVHVYVGATLAGVIPASESRADIGRAFPDYGPNHGYSLRASAPAGTHQVCVAAENVGSGASIWLGCRSATVAGAGPGSAEALGERGWYSYEDFGLTDRLQAKVNVSSGNLLLAATDLTLAGTGIDLGIGHHYNSRSIQDNPAGRGWTLSTASGVFLEHRTSDGAKLFHAPTGAVIVFLSDGAGGFRAPSDYDAKLVASGSGHKLTMTGDKSEWEFDPAGRAVAQKAANNNASVNRNRISFTYNPTSGQLDTVTDSRGRQVSFTYQAGRIKTMNDVANGRSFVYDYDPSGRLLTKITSPPKLAGESAVVTEFGYDAADNLNRITDPEGRVTTIAYTTDDKVRSVTRAGPQAPTTTFDYFATAAQTCADAGFGSSNPCTKVSAPPINSTNPLTAVTSYKLDAQANHRVEQVKDALGHKRSKQYNSSGNVSSYTDALDKVGTVEYDPVSGHNVTATKLATGASSTYEYTDTANPRSTTKAKDAQGNARQFTYDTAGNPTSASANKDRRANTAETSPYSTLDYNTEAGTRQDGTLASLKHPQESGGAEVFTRFTYNDRGERTGVDNPAPLGDESFTYDAASRVRTHTDGMGRMRTYDYDAYDRVTQVRYGGTPTCDTSTTCITFSYDKAGNRATMVDNRGTTTNVFDELNRATSEAESGLLGVGGHTNTYTYDPSGNLKTYTDAAGTVTYRHNVVNLVDQISAPGEAKATTVTYDDANRRDKVSYPNDVVEDSDYDDSGRLKAIKATKAQTVLTSFAYDYKQEDQGGADGSLRNSVTENVASLVNERSTYTYDGLSRLDTAVTKAVASGAQVHAWDYDYDRRSNRTCETADGAKTKHTYNDAYQLTSAGSTTNCATAPASPTTYSYDGVGNQTASSGGQGFSYNPKNQTTSITPPGAAPKTYDYSGATQDRRTRAGETSFTNSLLGVSYSYPGTLLPPLTPLTAWTRDDQGTLIGQRSPDGARHYYLFDGLGSVVAMTDAAGNVVNRYRYDPYGKPMAGPGTTEAVPNPWRYAAGYRDADTGFTKFGTRYYDPTLGRWTQQDPSGQDANPYAYVGGDPVNMTDPSGRKGSCLIEHYGGSYDDPDTRGCIGGSILRTFTKAAPKAFSYARTCALAYGPGAAAGFVAGAPIGGIGAGPGAFIGGSAACQAAVGTQYLVENERFSFNK